VGADLNVECQNAECGAEMPNLGHMHPKPTNVECLYCFVLGSVPVLDNNMDEAKPYWKNKTKPFTLDELKQLKAEADCWSQRIPVKRDDTDVFCYAHSNKKRKVWLCIGFKSLTCNKILIYL